MSAKLIATDYFPEEWRFLNRRNLQKISYSYDLQKYKDYNFWANGKNKFSNT